MRVVVRCRPMNEKEQESSCARYFLFNERSEKMIRIDAHLSLEWWRSTSNVDRSPFDARPVTRLIARTTATMINTISSSMLSMIGSECSLSMLLQSGRWIVVPNRKMSTNKQLGYSSIRFWKVSMERSLPTGRQERGKRLPWKVRQGNERE